MERSNGIWTGYTFAHLAVADDSGPSEKDLDAAFAVMQRFSADPDAGTLEENETALAMLNAARQVFFLRKRICYDLRYKGAAR